MNLCIQQIWVVILVLHLSSLHSLPTPQQWYLTREPRYNGQSEIRRQFSMSSYFNRNPSYDQRSYSNDAPPSLYREIPFSNNRFSLPNSMPRSVLIPSRFNLPSSVGSLSQLDINLPKGMRSPPIGEYVIVVNDNEDPIWIKLDRPMPPITAFSPILAPLNFQGYK